MKAIRKLQPSKRNGPWHLLCDNEKFLSAKTCHTFYKRKDIKLLQIPPRSPDINPIEMFWSWLRKHLRLLDLEDLRRRRRPLVKATFKARVKSVLRSRHAQRTAIADFRALKKKCKEVILKKGAAIRS